MREIKFRVWNEDKKEMLDIQRHSFKTNKSMPYGWNMEYVFDELMQYTGLQDKDGREIYEGDIIESRHFCKFIVSYKNGAFVRSIENSNIYLLYDTSIVDDCLEDYKVVGNIYENPEMVSI